MTECFMRKARFNNVDFIFVNLKNTSFKGSRFCKVVFNGCNLKDVDFSSCVFENTYFINCNLSDRQKSYSGIRIINKLEYEVSDNIKKLILSISKNKLLEKYRVLSIKDSKPNKVMLNLLLLKFTENQIIDFLKQVSITNRKQFRTVHDYIDSLEEYHQLWYSVVVLPRIWKLWKEWGLQVDIASIQEVLLMINFVGDVLTFVSIIIFIIEKILEIVPPRLLEVENY